MFEIKEAVKKLKNYISSGIDEISNEQLKYGAPGILPWLRSLFESVWRSEDVPSDWRKKSLPSFQIKETSLTVITTEVSPYAQLRQS